MNNDKTTIHIVVIFIGVIAFALAVGMLVLNYQDKGIDPTLNTLGGAALGSLVTLLTSTRGTKDGDAAPVSVVNSDPIPVQETEGRHAADAEIGTGLEVSDLTA